MKLKRASIFLSLLANFGVVVGIIFLVIEVNQNTNAIHASTIQALEQGVSEVIPPWTASVENAALLFRGRKAFDELTEEERIFVGLLIRRLYLHMDSYYWANKNGALPTELWDREKSVLRSWVNSPGGRVIWERGGFSQSFEEFVETELIEH